MFCPSCGAQNADTASRCASCGTHFTGAALRAGAAQLAQSSVVKGFFVLWGAWFTMPFKTLRITGQQLREIGGGGLSVANDIPHLTWVRVAGGTVASIAVLLALIGGVIKGLTGLGDIRWNTSGALLGLIGYPLLGLLLAIVMDWFVMMGTEMLGLWVSMSHNIKKLAVREP
jgi:hypothetical protein